MNSIYVEALEEFKLLTGTSFHDELYPTPASVPAELLKIVSKLKVSQAETQQIDLIYQMQRYKKGGIAVLPDEKKHLPDDFNSCKDQIELWSATL